MLVQQHDATPRHATPRHLDKAYVQPTAYGPYGEAGRLPPTHAAPLVTQSITKHHKAAGADRTTAAMCLQVRGSRQRLGRKKKKLPKRKKTTANRTGLYCCADPPCGKGSPVQNHLSSLDPPPQRRSKGRVAIISSSLNKWSRRQALCRTAPPPRGPE